VTQGGLRRQSRKAKDIEGGPLNLFTNTKGKLTIAAFLQSTGGSEKGVKSGKKNQFSVAMGV